MDDVIFHRHLQSSCIYEPRFSPTLHNHHVLMYIAYRLYNCYVLIIQSSKGFHVPLLKQYSFLNGNPADLSHYKPLRYLLRCSLTFPSAVELNLPDLNSWLAKAATDWRCTGTRDVRGTVTRWKKAQMSDIRLRRNHLCIYRLLRL